jgi:hypothetical protein
VWVFQITVAHLLMPSRVFAVTIVRVCSLTAQGFLRVIMCVLDVVGEMRWGIAVL